RPFPVRGGRAAARRAGRPRGRILSRRRRGRALGALTVALERIRRTTLKAEVATAIAATALTLLGVEIALRAVEGATGVDFFHVMLDQRRTSPDTDLRLIDLIRRSSNEELIYELAPNVRGRFKGAPIAIDDRGVRVPDGDGASGEAGLHLIGI